jgi:hypothetical protein
VECKIPVSNEGIDGLIRFLSKSESEPDQPEDDRAQASIQKVFDHDVGHCAGEYTCWRVAISVIAEAEAEQQG